MNESFFLQYCEQLEGKVNVASISKIYVNRIALKEFGISCQMPISVRCAGFSLDVNAFPNLLHILHSPQLIAVIEQILSGDQLMHGFGIIKFGGSHCISFHAMNPNLRRLAA